MTGKGDPKDLAFRYTVPRESIHIMTSSGVEGHAKIIATHPEIDICVIQTPDVALTPVKGVAKFGDVKVGERVYSIGNPKGIAFTIAEGLVSGKRAAADLSHGLHSDFILFSAPISHGSSGGALFNANGQLVGISQGFIEDAQNVNLAIPADELWRSFPDRGGRLGGC
jgi:S1-C subfamily serine protease